MFGCRGRFLARAWCLATVMGDLIDRPERNAAIRQQEDSYLQAGKVADTSRDDAIGEYAGCPETQALYQ